ASKFASTSLLRMVMQGFNMRIYTGLGRMSLCLVQALALLHSKFAVGVTNGRERERGSQVWWKMSGNVCVCVCVCWSIGRVRSPLNGVPPIPFIAQARLGDRIQKGWKSEKRKV